MITQINCRTRELPRERERGVDMVEETFVETNVLLLAFSREPPPSLSRSRIPQLVASLDTLTHTTIYSLQDYLYNVGTC